MNRSIPALAIAGALVLGSALVAAPAQAAPGDGTYYSVPYSGNLIQVLASPDGPSLSIAGFEDWKADGFPTPRPAVMEYVKYTWGPTVFADAIVDDASFSAYLDYGTWLRLGSPTPRTDRLAASSYVFRYQGSDELFVSEGVAFADEPAFHKLTLAEYRHLGSPALEYDDTPAYRKLAWNDSIVGPDRYTGQVGPIDFATWDDLARPTPQIVKSFDGDRFCQAAGSADIRYIGIAAPKGVKLTYAQWREAGFPAPARC